MSQRNYLANVLVPIAAVLVAIGYGFYCLSTGGDEPGVYYALLLHAIVVILLLLYKKILPLGEPLVLVWSIGVVAWALIHALALGFFGTLKQRIPTDEEPNAILHLSQSAQGFSLAASLALTGAALWVALRSRGRQDEPSRTLAMFVLFFLMVTFSLSLALGLDDTVRRFQGKTPGLYSEVIEDAPRLLSPEEAQACRESSASGGAIRAEIDFAADSLVLAHGEQYTLEADTSDCATLETAGQRNECNLLRVSKAVLCQPEARAVPVIIAFPLEQLSTSPARDLATHRYVEIQHAIRASLIGKAKLQNAVYSSIPEPIYSRTTTTEVPLGRVLVEVATPAFGDGREAWVLRQGNLTLLDYLYFTVYTITTTGYGDIRPVSPFAKFATTLGNLYEFVFIVLVFSLAFSRSPNPVAEDQAHAEPSIVADQDAMTMEPQESPAKVADAAT